MGDWFYTYDVLGNLQTQTDARGCISTLAYDDLTRLTGKTYSGTCTDTADVTYSYDLTTPEGNKGIGHRTGMTDGSGSTSWVYDVRGRVLSETKSITGERDFTTSFSYNSADLPLSITYPDGGSTPEVVTNGYNPQMQLDTVSGTDNYITNTEYDAAARMTKRQFGNNTETNYDYYDWNVQNGRLKTVQSGLTPSGTDPFSATLQDVTYVYDTIGNIKKHRGYP